MRHVSGFGFFKTIVSLLLVVTFLPAFLMAEDGKAAGAATFKAKCVLCHGADGTGSTVLGKQLQAANLRSKEVQKKADADLHKAVHDGNGNMPPFADQLSDDEIAQVIKYVRTLAKVAKK